MDNELINRSAKKGFIDNVTLGYEERYGFEYNYVLKVQHLAEVSTGIVLSRRCTTGGYQDVKINSAPEEVKIRAYDRMSGFMTDYIRYIGGQ